MLVAAQFDANRKVLKSFEVYNEVPCSLVSTLPLPDIALFCAINVESRLAFGCCRVCRVVQWLVNSIIKLLLILLHDLSIAREHLLILLIDAHQKVDETASYH